MDGGNEISGNRRPKRIVLASIGTLGDLHPFLAVGQELSRRGHAVIVATTENHRHVVAAAGLAYHRLRPAPESTEAFGRKFTHPVTGPAFVFRDYLSPVIETTYDDLREAAEQADLMVSQTLVLAAPIVAATTGVPWLSAVLQPFAFFSVDDPPRVPALPFVRSGRIPTGKRREINAMILRYAKQFTLRWVAPVLSLRVRLGLPPAGHPIYEGQHAPGKVLAMFPAMIGAPQADWPAHSVQTGAALFDERAPLPVGLDAFLDNGPPPVIFTLGSSSCREPGRFFAESIKAARLAGLRAVLVTGKDEPANRDVVRDDNNLFTCRYAPYSKIFPRAAVIVHSGGIGTTMQAVRAGRPQLIVPFAHDQADNAHRAKAAGLARLLPKRRYRARRVAENLRAMLADGRMADACRDAAVVIGAQDGACIAADEIERFLDERS